MKTITNQKQDFIPLKSLLFVSNVTTWYLILQVQSEISRQDSKGSSSNNSWSVSSYESMKVCDDNRETVKK